MTFFNKLIFFAFFCGLSVRPDERKVRPTQERWEALRDKVLGLMAHQTCRIRQWMSLIGLLTATEKLVHMGRLHIRPLQWHLKANWQVPESLEKVIPVPATLHPHLKWWLSRDNVMGGQLLHPMSHALQVFTDASTAGWGAHLARGSWSVPNCTSMC